MTYIPESAEEKEFLASYNPADYPVITHTVDMVVVGMDWHHYVLLIKRGNWPYRDRWALPGGFIEPWETTLEAAVRELHEEAGLKVPAPTFLMLADRPDRDPRGRCISSVYLSKTLGTPKVYANDDAREALWVRMSDALEMDLAFDHNEILRKALEND